MAYLGGNNHKILMFGWEYAPFIAGGLGVVCRAISQSLANDHNVQVTYVLPNIPEQLATGGTIKFKSAGVKASDGVNLVSLDASLPQPYFPSEAVQFYSGQSNVNGAIYGANLLAEVEDYSEKAAHLAEKTNFDVIHAHDWMTASAGTAAKAVTDKPMIFHVHATEMERTLGNPDPRIFEKELAGMESADKIIAVSEATRDRIVANYGIESSKIVVVHNALERIESKYGPIARNIHNDDKVILFLARLTAMKGAQYLLAAGAKVTKVIPNTKILFVGTGELLENLIEQSVDLGIANKVTFTGFLPHDQVDRVYRYADVFVMPSVAEPFGITPLEAIKNGTPVILSKQSGASEVLQNVLKVDFWDVDELANKLIAVLKHGVLAEELTNNSRQDLEKLNWGEQSRKIIDIYSELKRNYKVSYDK